jgi:hypothetical protein
MLDTSAFEAKNAVLQGTIALAAGTSGTIPPARKTDKPLPRKQVAKP